ncbi:beta strand repeat-containing protein [Lactobacillaceae bacterium Melli_B3]
MFEQTQNVHADTTGNNSSTTETTSANTQSSVSSNNATGSQADTSSAGGSSAARSTASSSSATSSSSADSKTSTADASSATQSSNDSSSNSDSADKSSSTGSSSTNSASAKSNSDSSSQSSSASASSSAQSSSDAKSSGSSSSSASSSDSSDGLSLRNGDSSSDSTTSLTSSEAYSSGYSAAAFAAATGSSVANSSDANFNSGVQAYLAYKSAFSNGFSAVSSAIAAGSSVANSSDSNFNSGVQAYYAANAGAVNAWNSLHPDDTKPAISAGTFNSSNAFYVNGYNATIDAYNTYNSLNSGAGTQSGASAYGSNTNTPFTSNGSVNRNISAQVVNSPNDSAEASSSNNVQSGTAGNIAGTGINTVAPDQKLAYNYAIDYFLGRQGAYDAETGRWNGKDSNGSYTVFDGKTQSNNPYTQAYNGAQTAITNAQNNSSSTAGNQKNTISPINSGDANYQYGYNDVYDKVQNKNTIFVSTDTQLTNSGFRGYLSNLSGTVTIRLLNDFNVADSYNYTKANSNLNLIVDGQNHLADFRSYQMTYTGTNVNLTIQNFRKMYAYTYYGPINNNGGSSTSGTATFKNVNYEGSQLFYGTNIPFIADGVVNANSVGQYTSPYISNFGTQGSNQQNLQVGSMTVKKGASYYGKTQNGNVIELGGNLTLEDGATMTLTPMGSSCENKYGPGSGNYGLVVGNVVGNNNSGNVQINNNASLNITPGDAVSDPLKIQSGNININGGSLNINYNQNPTDPLPTYVNGGITVGNGGNLNVHATNGVNNYGGSLIYLAPNVGTLNVQDRGNLSVIADGANTNSKMTLLNNGGNVTISNPGKNVVISKIGSDPTKKDSIVNSGGGQGNLFYQTPVIAYSVKPQIDNLEKNDPKYVVTIDKSGNWTTWNSNGTSGQDSDLNAAYKNNSGYISFHAVPTVFITGNASLQTDNNAGSKFDVITTLSLSNVTSTDGYVYVRTTTNGTDEKPVTGDNPDDSSIKTNSNGMLLSGQPTANGGDNDYRDGYTTAIPVSKFTHIGDKDSGQYVYQYVHSLNAANGTPNDVIVTAQYQVTNNSVEIKSSNGQTVTTKNTHNPATTALTIGNTTTSGTLTQNATIQDNVNQTSSAASGATSFANQASSAYSSTPFSSYSSSVASAYSAISNNSSAVNSMANDSAVTSNSDGAKEAINSASSAIHSYYNDASSQSANASSAASVASSAASEAAAQASTASSANSVAASAQAALSSASGSSYTSLSSVIASAASSASSAVAKASSDAQTVSSASSAASSAVSQASADQSNAAQQQSNITSIYSSAVFKAHVSAGASSASSDANVASSAAGDSTSGASRDSTAVSSQSTTTSTAKQNADTASSSASSQSSVANSVASVYPNDSNLSSYNSTAKSASSAISSQQAALSSDSSQMTSANSVAASAYSTADSAKNRASVLHH